MKSINISCRLQLLILLTTFINHSQTKSIESSFVHNYQNQSKLSSEDWNVTDSSNKTCISLKANIFLDILISQADSDKLDWTKLNVSEFIESKVYCGDFEGSQGQQFLEWRSSATSSSTDNKTLGNSLTFNFNQSAGGFYRLEGISLAYLPDQSVTTNNTSNYMNFTASGLKLDIPLGKSIRCDNPIKFLTENFKVQLENLQFYVFDRSSKNSSLNPQADLDNPVDCTSLIDELTLPKVNNTIPSNQHVSSKKFSPKEVPDLAYYIIGGVFLFIVLGIAAELIFKCNGMSRLFDCMCPNGCARHI